MWDIHLFPIWDRGVTIMIKGSEWHVAYEPPRWGREWRATTPMGQGCLAGHPFIYLYIYILILSFFLIKKKSLHVS
jgi:hypothetical protein